MMLTAMITNSKGVNGYKSIGAVQYKKQIELNLFAFTSHIVDLKESVCY